MVTTTQHCMHFREYDWEGREYGYCKGKQCKTTCLGTLNSCKYLTFFNAPEHRLQILRYLQNTYQAFNRELAVYELGIKKEDK